MGHETSPVRAPAQHLQCADPWVVLWYNTLLHDQLTAANVFNHAQTLQHSITGMCLTKAQQVEYKALDHISVASKKFAKHHCQKIKAGTIPWCPQVS